MAMFGRVYQTTHPQTRFILSAIKKHLNTALLPSLALFATLTFTTVPVWADRMTFPAGSLIIPMDTDYQDSGMLKAYGLVDKLLRAGVPVIWCINPDKTVIVSAQGNFGADFSASAADFKTGAVITAHGYRGGPFVIDFPHAAAATPIITAWQANNQTTVHAATQAFDATARLVLTASPRIAVLAGSAEAIIFSYLNAAGITDESNLPWTTTSVNLLTQPQVAGLSTSNPADGALFNSSGQPKFCALVTGHWNTTSPEIPHVVPEIQSFLQFPTHLFAECQAVAAIEGEPPSGGRGKLLTSAGFINQPRPFGVQFSGVEQPFAQMDGAFGTVGGSHPAFGLATGSTYYDNSSVMVRSTNASSVGLNDVWIGGYYTGTCPLSSLGNCTNPGPKGKVTYLGGHAYTTTVPISASPTTQGARLFLNSIFAGSCAHAEGQPVISITAAAPATTTDATITYTLFYSNDGPGPGLGVQLTDVLPPNTSFVSATAGGTFSGGKVNWNLGDLASGVSGSVSVTVNLLDFGTYSNQATASYAIGLTSKAATSNSVQTDFIKQTPPIADAGPDQIIEATGPAGATVSLNGSGSSDPDGDALSYIWTGPFGSVSGMSITVNLPLGVHIVTLTVSDGSESAMDTVMITVQDTTAPAISASQMPLPNTNGWNNSNVTVSFSATDAVSMPTCTVNTATLTTDGAGQVVSTTCTDAAGNSASASHTVNLDKAAPVLTLPSLASSYSLNSSITMTFAAADALSNIATQSATLNGNPVSSGSTVVLTQLGTNIFSITATDQAGNSVTETRQFTVNSPYTFGFLSPLGGNRTTFHLGSTIPVKFELFDANGAAVTTAVASLSLQQLSTGGLVGNPIDATPTGGADSGNLFRYSGGHYIYNLSTKPFTAGIWRIQVILDDGTVRTIEIGLTAK